MKIAMTAFPANIPQLETVNCFGVKEEVINGYIIYVIISAAN